MTQRIYIVDIDGTLARLDHRLYHVKVTSPPDWDAFFDACEEDGPIMDVIEVIRCIGLFGWAGEPDEPQIVYLTSRPERIREKTIQWLMKYGLPNGTLIMRRDGDHRPDTVAKPEMLKQVSMDGRRIAGVFEDRPSMCRVWREMGFTVFQLQHEEF